VTKSKTRIANKWISVEAEFGAERRNSGADSLDRFPANIMIFVTRSLMRMADIDVITPAGING
jgi:hypothetical protein